MRLLVEDLVLSTHPHLLDVATRTHPEWEGEQFLAHGSPRSAVEVISGFRPDVILVHSTWLHVAAPLIPEYLKMSRCPHTRTVVAAHPLDSVAMIQAAHHGFFDAADLGDTDQYLTKHMGEVGRGISRLSADPLWQSVTRPLPLPSMEHVADGATDLAVLDLIRIGLADNDIAEVLYLSPQTVRNRVSAMLRRAGLVNRTQMAWAHTNHVLVARMLAHLDWHP